MDTIPIFRRKEEAKNSEDRTKRVVLEFYDAMNESITAGEPYRTRLDALPADIRRCHTQREIS